MVVTYCRLYVFKGDDLVDTYVCRSESECITKARKDGYNEKDYSFIADEDAVEIDR